MILRPYQSEMLDDLRSSLRTNQKVCAVLPTGGGKTVMFCQMGRGVIQKGKRVWFLAHRTELVEQISNTLLSFDVAHGLIVSGSKIASHQSNAYAGMIRTTRKRLGYLNPPDLLVIDECHHTPASEYSDIVSAMPPTTKIVGFTATPERLDGVGLGKYYSDMVLGPSTGELIDMGYLVPPIVYAPKLIDTKGLHKTAGDYDRGEAAELLDKPSITGDAIEHYRRLANNTLAIAFCVTIDHAKHVAERFRNAGIPAASVDGKMSRSDRDSIINSFRAGNIRVLTSADLVSEGFDLPSIQTAILLRPTQSLGLFLQQCGRALRVEHGKSKAIILDHVQNTIRHGLPDDAREWSLDGRKKRAKKEDETARAIHTCSDCFMVYTGDKCPGCKKEREAPAKPQERDGELIQINQPRAFVNAGEISLLSTCPDLPALQNTCEAIGVELSAAKKILIARSRTLADLQSVGKLLGYKPGWADHRHAARTQRMKKKAASN